MRDVRTVILAIEDEIDHAFARRIKLEAEGKWPKAS